MEINNHKRLEQAVRTANEMLQSLIRVSPVAIVLLDDQDRVQIWNPAAEHIFGWSAEEALGKKNPIVPADRGGEYQALTQQLLAGQPLLGLETVRQRKDGSLVDVSISSAVFHGSDGRFSGRMAVLQDISEQKRTERELRQSEKRYRLLAEHAEDVIWTLNLKTMRFTYISPSITHLRGLTVEEALDEEFIQALTPESLLLVTRILGEAIQKFYAGELESNYTVTEVQQPCKDGTVKDVEVIASFILDEQGAISEVLGVSRDITLRKQTEKQLRLARDQAEALRDSAIELNSTLNVDELMDLIMEQVGKVITNDASAVYLIEEHIARAVRWRDRRVPGHGDFSHLRFDVRLTANMRQMKETQKPVVVRDTHAAPDWIIFPEIDWINSYAGAPISIQGQIVGFLEVDSSIPGFYTVEDAEHLAAFAAQVGVALQNSRLYESVNRRLEEQSILNEVIRLAASKLEMGEFLQVVYRQVNRFIAAHFFMIASYEPETEEWVSQFLIKNDELFAPIRHSTQEGFAGYVISTRKSLYLRDQGMVEAFQKEKGVNSLMSTPRSVMIVPLMISDRVIGVMGVQDDDRDNAFSQEDFNLFSSIGVQISVTYENARLYARMEEMATTDLLTGVYNRHQLLTLAQQEYEQARRYQRPMSLVMLDADHFKQINDTYGHPVGDQALRGLAACCKQVVRAADIVGRYGGEEFMLVMPETRLAQAVAAAERLRQSVALMRMPEVGSLPVITVSLGVASLDLSRDESLDYLIKRADDSLYAAKAAGRNRVCNLDEVPPGF